MPDEIKKSVSVEDALTESDQKIGDRNEEYSYYYPESNVSIKDVQNIGLEILNELDRICSLKHIPYQLAYGTLLGAIRHRGFIPWDDDIDVFMKRSDYERFLEEGTAELNEKYFLQTCFTDPDCVVQFAKIRKNGTVFENDVDNLPTTNNGIWIDIFPLDNVKPGTLAGWYQRFQIALYYAIVTSSVKSRVVHCKKVYKKIIRFLFYYLLQLFPKKYFVRKLQKVFTRYNDVDTGYFAHLTNGLTKGINYKFVAPYNGYYDMCKMEFCGKRYPCPRNYDDVLKKCFGNYMELPPEDKRHPEHGIMKVKI